jgi:hypothetical protein
MKLGKNSADAAFAKPWVRLLDRAFLGQTPAPEATLAVAGRDPDPRVELR